MRAWIIGTHGTNRAMIRPTQHAWDRMLPFRRAINQNTVWVFNGSLTDLQGHADENAQGPGSMWQGGTKGGEVIVTIGGSGSGRRVGPDLSRRDRRGYNLSAIVGTVVRT